MKRASGPSRSETLKKNPASLRKHIVNLVIEKFTSGGTTRGEKRRKDNQREKPPVREAEDTGRAKELCVAKLERVKSRLDAIP